MEKTVCPGCGIEHFPAQNWLHMECVTNGPMNQPVLEQAAPVVNPDVINRKEVSRTKSGRDREKYNAYMRSYMAKKRAKA